MKEQPAYQPLVSVVITTYNHARYIIEAIESVKRQTYAAIEIIVIDDGSTDQTAAVVKELAGVKYLYQPNKGLPAARNAGILHSSGDYIVFLDADDWLLPQAVSINGEILDTRPELAFVAGAHQFYIEKDNEIRPVVKEKNGDYYCRLLEGNFIGMHATVMYRRRVFDEFHFDESLANCEDFDFYLQVVRKYPMLYHTEIVAVYRLHEYNMSGDARKMLEGAYAVFEKHRAATRTAHELACLERGRQNFCDFYMAALEKEFYLRLYYKGGSISLDEIQYLKKQNTAVYNRFIKANLGYLLKNPGQLTVYGWRKLLPRSILLRLIAADNSHQ